MGYYYRIYIRCDLLYSTSQFLEDDMNNVAPAKGRIDKKVWHTPNVYILRGSVTEKPQAPDEGLFKQPSSFEHPDRGDPQGYPHGPTDDVVGPS